MTVPTPSKSKHTKPKQTKILITVLDDDRAPQDIADHICKLLSVEFGHFRVAIK